MSRDWDEAGGRAEVEKGVVVLGIWMRSTVLELWSSLLLSGQPERRVSSVQLRYCFEHYNSGPGSWKGSNPLLSFVQQSVFRLPRGICGGLTLILTAAVQGLQVPLVGWLE